MDSEKSENDKELTSTTMGNVLSSSSTNCNQPQKEEKNDTGDATPTSSTDASTSAATSQIVSDDPISSTSSEAVASKPAEGESTGKMDTSDDTLSNFDKDAELRAIGLHNVSDEKITENVEDLVHDLENLLGGSTEDFTVKSLSNKEEENVKVNDTKNSTADNSVTVEVQDVQVENVDQSTQETEEIAAVKNTDSTPSSSSTTKDTQDAQNTMECLETNKTCENEEQVKIISQTDSESDKNKDTSISNTTESPKTEETTEKVEAVNDNGNIPAEESIMEVDTSEESCTSSSVQEKGEIDMQVDKPNEQPVPENPEIKENVVENVLEIQLEKEESIKVPEDSVMKKIEEKAVDRTEKAVDSTEKAVDSTEKETENSSNLEMTAEDAKDEPDRASIIQSTNETVVTTLESQKEEEVAKEVRDLEKIPENPGKVQEELEKVQIVEKVPEDIEKVSEEPPRIESIPEKVESENPQPVIQEAQPVIRKMTPYDREVVNAFGKDFTEDIVPPLEESLIKVIEEQAAASSSIRPSIIRKPVSVPDPLPQSSSAMTKNQFVPEVIENTIVLDAPVDNREHKEIVTIQQAVASIMDDSDSSVLKITTVTAGNSSVTSTFHQKSVETMVSPKDAHNKPEKVEKLEKKTDKNELLKEPLTINVTETVQEKEKIYSPKITIKPIRVSEEEISTTSSCGASAGTDSETAKGSLKMTITKQSDNTHSILKIYNPDESESQNNEESMGEPQTVPKLVIKPMVQPNEQQPSPKMTTRSSKSQAFHSPTTVSPRITIKPIKSETKSEATAPLKITIKTGMKQDELPKQKNSPKLTIKPIKTDEEVAKEHSKVQNPRVTIKPIVKPDEAEPLHSPRITIKPIPQPNEGECGTSSPTPKITIKPIKKPDELEVEPIETVTVGRSSPKITIKPVVKPDESAMEVDDVEAVKERIVLKINKGNLPTPSKESKKRSEHNDDEKSEKLAKIKLKFSKEGHPQIVQPHHKRQHEENTPSAERKKLRSSDTDTPALTEKVADNMTSPILISEDSNENSAGVILLEDNAKDPIDDIPTFEISSNTPKNLGSQAPSPSSSTTSTSLTPASTPTMPRKRGRPRKVPLVVREEFNEEKDESLTAPVEIETPPVATETPSGRPKRSCRGGQNVRDTLGLKTRKPRGGGRGRGSRRGMGNRVVDMKPAKVPKLTKAKLKLLQKQAAAEVAAAAAFQQQPEVEEFKPFEKADVDIKAPNPVDAPAPPTPTPPPAPPLKSEAASSVSVADSADIVMYEEETRMSAETNSRAQTPAKQVVVQQPLEIDESQSSFLSNATTESKASLSTPRPSKAAKLDVIEPEGSVLSADDLAEYYWGGNGPFMLQEQVAQFLGIKSFKRKYPGIPRRMVDMQERDFIRESGLASEAMCDLGLTAVNSADILEIMYTDFQDKYEEYCKHKRDREAKDLTNKQKALLAASQEKNKLDITEQAKQSAALWNLNFNKARKEQRKASMDLQTLNVHYPKNKMKQINKAKVGNYPVALVPGQFTDYYKEFTPTQINNLPLNTMCYDAIHVPNDNSDDDSGSNGSDSDSDSSSSSSSSSDSSSGVDDCKLCKPEQVVKKVTASVTPSVAAATAK